ncbi:MAG: thioredoxin [Vicingaceae bacterium]
MSKFNALINSETPVLVDFFAEWCGPCKTMSPILKQAAGMLKNKVKIIKVDIDKNPAVARKYNVRGVPNFILFHKGEIKWQQSGVMSAQQMVNLIQQKIA